MMDEDRIGAAAALVWRLWTEGGRMDALPDALSPGSRKEGYAIQARLAARSPRPVIGWKIAATSRAGQAHIGVDGPLAGRLLAERLRGEADTISLAHNHMRVAEPEFAFLIARDLPPRAAPYAMDEVLSAVGALHLAIEVPDSRFTNFARVGAPSLIADNACTDFFVRGPVVDDDWRAVDLAAHAVQARVGRRYARDGLGANVLGDPRIAIAWLANELRGLGITLAAGQIVTTGTCMPPLEVQPGDVVEADFGAFGRVAARFGP